MMGLLAKIFDILYPERNICLNCGRKYLFSELRSICDYCLGYVEFLEFYCIHCGRAMDEVEELCSFCHEHVSAFDLARSVGVYDGLLKNLILKFKYEGCQELSRPLVELLAIAFEEHYFHAKVDRIVSVPIHATRLQERGFNQAELLAGGLALKTGIPLSTAVKRIKEQAPLYNYAYQERKELLKNSFSVEDGIFAGENILLVDDIFTTGATTSEISRLLKDKAGAKEVRVLTVATVAAPERTRELGMVINKKI